MAEAGTQEPETEDASDDLIDTDQLQAEASGDIPQLDPDDMMDQIMNKI